VNNYFQKTKGGKRYLKDTGKGFENVLVLVHKYYPNYRTQFNDVHELTDRYVLMNV